MKIAYPFSKINQISLYTKVRYPILYKNNNNKNIKMLESLKQKTGNNLSKVSRSVPGTGLEPVRTNVHWILSPTCLPIPPPGQVSIFVRQRLLSE